MRELLFKFLAWMFPSEKDLLKNKHLILRALFICEHKELSTEESLELFQSVQREFHRELQKRYLDAKIEAEFIDGYFRVLSEKEE